MLSLSLWSVMDVVCYTEQRAGMYFTRETPTTTPPPVPSASYLTARFLCNMRPGWLSGPHEMSVRRAARGRPALPGHACRQDPGTRHMSAGAFSETVSRG